MRAALLKLVTEVIRQASKSDPADAVLRRKLKTSGLDRKESAEASHAVFAYFRWFGWRQADQPLETQVEQALKLGKEFELKPFPDRELAERAIPEWIAQEMTVEPEWVRSLQREPRLWLRARPGTGAALGRKLGHCRASEISPDALEYLGREDLFSTAAFHSGEFEIQDVTSQAVGLLCAPKAGETWWDASAGEGGKLLHLADLMGNRGLIWATDRAAWRLARLKRRAARARVFNYRARLWNGELPLPVKTRFDGVLVDAPCSGVGTWQRNPHAKWTTTREDVLELAQVQKELLSRVAGSVKPGGRLIYAVCTLTRSETTGVRDDFEKRNSGFERLHLAEKAKSPPKEEIWLWPQESGGNGMFVAGWQRRV